MSACVVHSKPTEARHGLLCTVHFDRLADMLRQIEEEAAILSAVPSMAIRTGSGGGSLASERAPARVSVLAYLDPRTKRWEPDAEPRYVPPAPKSFGPWCLFCDHETCTAWRAGRRRDLHDDEHDAGSEALASVLEELHTWARVVREERALAQPQQITVSGERDLLTRQLEWIAEQPWVDECFADLRKILGQLQAVNHTTPEKAVGRCYLPTEDGTCGGTIRRTPSTGQPWITLEDRCTRTAVKTVDGHARCDTCRQTWDGPQLAMLMFELEQIKAEKARPKTEDGRRMLTTQELAQRWNTSVDNVRKMASRQGIRAVLGHYDPDRFRRQGQELAS